MSGRHIVAFALDDANDEKNHGAGYTVNLWLRSGRQVHGSVMGGVMRPFSGGLYLELELWAKTAEADLGPTGRHVVIDPKQVEQIEVCW
jgi:hypothetical protein